jgi:hypothetical protein
VNGRPLIGDRLARWAGLFGGAICWYAAHEASFYTLRMNNCAAASSVVAAIHVLALLVTLAAGALSFRTARLEDWTRFPSFAGTIGLGAAAIFAIVIIWQGAAGFVYSGCDR